MSLKKCYTASLTLVIVGGVVFVHGGIVQFQAGILIGFLAMGAGLILEIAFYRCPHCGSHLGRISPWLHSHCPHCGGRIDWEEKLNWRR